MLGDGMARERTVVSAVAVSDGTGSDGFEGVRSAWSELEGHARHFFQAWEWIKCVAPHAPGDVRLGVLREDGRPVATSVLARSVRRVAGIDFVILHNGLHWRLADGLIDPAVRGRITVEKVADVFGRWDVLHLCRLRLGSAWLELDGCTKHVRAEPGHGVAVLDTAMAFEERWSQLPKKLRQSIRTARNRIERRGGAEVIVSTHDDVAAAFDQHVALEAGGWKGTCGAALTHTPHIRDTWGEYLRVSASAQIHTLHIDNRLAASICGTAHAGTFVALFMTYDESLAELSPGSVLFAELIEHCCADPTILRLDALGWAKWLDRWAFDPEPTYELLAFNGLRGGVAKLGYPIRRPLKSLR